ncbi:MAG: DUF1648 domain-containing protein [bacterium]
MKLYSKKEILPILLILITLAIGFYFYPQLPDRIPSHWNVNGQIDGFMPKTFAAFFFPGLFIFVYLLLSVLPLMDPHKTNIELFENSYFWFKVTLLLFLAGIHFITIYAAFGKEVDIGRFVSWGVGILFLFIGWMMPRIKKNYTIGIRLPWTLYSEVVWDKTHKLGSQLFMALAGILLLASFLPGVLTFWILMGGIILLMIILVAYSYLEYRKLAR